MRWYWHSYHTPFAHRLVFAIIPRLPKWLHPPIALLTAALFFALLRRERRAVYRNLARIRGRTGVRVWWTAYRVFYSFCDFVVSYCYVPRATHAELLRMLTDTERGADKIERGLAQGRGIVVWTAHLGNWEFGSRLLELHGRPVNVARLVEHDQPAEMMLRDLMKSARLRVVELHSDVLAPVRLLHALRDNQLVAVQGDRTYGNHYAEAPFCGAPARFPLGPFHLAYLAGAPVLPCLVVREGWLKYRVITGDLDTLPRTGNREGDLRAGLCRAVRFLEEHVRAYPDQWLNFYDFWACHAPPAQPRRASAAASPR